MIEVYPQLRDVKVEFVWGGTLDFALTSCRTPGEMDGIYYALGYAGHGVAMATWQGQQMAELIAGGKPDNPFVGIPFPGAPLGLVQRQAVVPALRRGLVQVSGLGKLTTQPRRSFSCRRASVPACFQKPAARAA